MVECCNGYLAHPFEKVGPLGFHHPSFSRYQVGLSHRSRRGIVPYHQRKQRGRDSKSLGKAYHGSYEWPAKYLSRHDATSWMDLVPQLDFRTRALASDCPMIVMVKPTHDRK